MVQYTGSTPTRIRIQLACGHVSPQFIVETFELSVGIFDVLLGLLPHVKDRTVLAGTKDILWRPP